MFMNYYKNPVSRFIALQLSNHLSSSFIRLAINPNIIQSQDRLNFSIPRKMQCIKKPYATMEALCQ